MSTDNPHHITREFESALCEYTGAPYAIAVNSCTMALLLMLAWMRMEFGSYKVSVPMRTYVSVPQCVLHTGHTLHFIDLAWSGAYKLWPLPVWDCARRFTSGMYKQGQFQCVSFHASKILGDTQGGAILHDNAEADEWLRRARFDGRTEGVAPEDDRIDMLGWHCYLSPDVAARLLWKLSVLPEHNTDLPNSDYPDLSTFQIFRQ